MPEIDVSLEEQERRLKELEDQAALQPQIKENLAKTIDPVKLEKIGNLVYDDFHNDTTSRSGLDDRMAEWMQLYNGVPKPKGNDTLDSSNVCIPLMTIACNQFHARTYEALIPEKEIVKCLARDDKKINASIRTENYMNYQLTQKMPEWPHDMSKAILSNGINGFVVKKTYYDSNTKRVVSLHLKADEFVAPYDVVRLEDAPRMTHVYKVTKNDIAINAENGNWINTEGMSNDVVRIDEVAQELQDNIDEAAGMDESVNQEDKPYMVLEQHRGLDLNDDGLDEPYIISVDKSTRKVLRIESRLYNDPRTDEEKTFDHFTPYIMIPNPNTWMGSGFGNLLEYLNQVVNTLYNQLIDCGKLANLSGNTGFIQEIPGFGGGDIQIKPGFFKGVKASGMDIKKALFQIQFSEPSTVLMALLNQVIEFSQQASSVSDAMTGEMPSSDTTATSMLNVMEQSLKVFSTIHKEIHAAFKKELKKIFILNSLYIDEAEYLEVQNSLGSEMVDFVSGAEDFSNMKDIVPVSDPNITSRTERYARARQAYEAGQQNRLITENDDALRALTYMYYKALEIPDVEIAKILKEPDPPPPPPDLNPIEEEAGFLKDQDSQPLIEQDHRDHYESHKIFSESQWAEQLTPQGKKLLDQHIKETLSFLYMTEMAALEEEFGIDEEGGSDIGRDTRYEAPGIGGVEGIEGNAQI